MIVTELLYTHDCNLLAHTEHELDISELAFAAHSFGLTINCKLEVMFQKSPDEIYSAPHITINGHPLIGVDHCRYLGSMVSNGLQENFITVLSGVDRFSAAAHSDALQTNKQKSCFYFPK